jgi:hypothetical protein
VLQRGCHIAANGDLRIQPTQHLRGFVANNTICWHSGSLRPLKADGPMVKLSSYADLTKAEMARWL